MERLEIPYKFPSHNEFIQACKTSAFAGSRMKKSVQNDIGYFINRLPVFTKPVAVKFIWQEGNEKRDIDNICFAKKFIFDTLVACGRIKDDSPKYVKGLADEFVYGDEWKVILEIVEIDERTEVKKLDWNNEEMVDAYKAGYEQAMIDVLQAHPELNQKKNEGEE